MATPTDDRRTSAAPTDAHAGASEDARGRDAHGRTAERPNDIPSAGRRDVLARVRSEVKHDHATLLSAGVAFYALLALVPGLAALISVYGLLADPERVETQVLDALSAAPAEVRDLVGTQFRSIAAGSDAATLLAAIAGTLAAIWSASAGIGHLIDALNVAYDEEERRGFVRRKLVALAFTAGAVVFVAVAFGAIALLPALVADTGLGAFGRVAIGIVRWVVLLAGLLVGLAVLYRYGPDREEARWRWTSPGAIVAATIWLIGSIAFSVYTANFAKYNETYGSLGAVVVLMLWLYLSSLSVIIGAELNAELERQTARDTTTGPPRPLGERRAHAADTIGEAASR
jgi:membrane protein